MWQRRSLFQVIASLGAVMIVSHSALAQGRASITWASIDTVLGRSGMAQPGGVMKYGFPRSDMQVTLNGVRLRPALALGSWLAFRDVGNGRAMVMGDLVLDESEVAPVIRALQEGGVEPTAVHNHLLHETPRVTYVHVSAMGDAMRAAQTVRAALDLTHTPPSVAPPASPPPVDLDTAAIARILGVAGKANGGVYQVAVPRREVIREQGMEILPSMGVATAINFQSTGNGRAAVTGDFVLRATEVSAVMRALRAAGIEPTALHSHMLDEEPRLLFMHFWGNDDALSLARGLRTALNRAGAKPVTVR